MFEITLNKFEKRDLIIKLHKEGKTYREIAHIAHVSVRDIKPILKKYDLKLKTKRGEENNQKIKKQSKCSQAYQLFLDGKTPVDVAIDLKLNYEKVRKYWTEFLRLQNMNELCEIYEENEFRLKYIFKIYYFIFRNKINYKDIENVLRVADDTAKLYQTHSNLKTEIEKLKQTKNNYSLNQNTTTYQQPVPLGPLPRYYNW